MLRLAPLSLSCSRARLGLPGTRSVSRAADIDSRPPPALQAWIDEITSRPPTVHHDVLDPLRASQLLRTLPTRQHLDSVHVGEGDTLAQGHHMVYFQPETMLRNLGSDGSSPEYNAPAPYTRRMWAGGRMAWPRPVPESGFGSDAHSPGGLRIGHSVSEERSIDKVEWKKDMVFIHQKRVIRDTGSSSKPAEGTVGVTEIRTHVFRPPSTSTSTGSTSTQSTPQTTAATSTPPDVSFTYTPTSPLLFRYSALTFNAHRIHYDRPHTMSVENQPDLLVHGPLTATLLIELAAREGPLRDFTYRAVSPIVVDREVQLVGWYSPQRDGLELQAVQGGTVGMRATARLYK